MNTEQIFKLAITENDETGQTYGLSHSTSKSIAGYCTMDAKNEDDYVLNIINYANTIIDSLQNEIVEIKENNFCDNEIEDSVLDEDDRIRRIMFENDIKILQSMIEWKFDMEKLKKIAHQNWRNLKNGQE